MNNLKIFAEFGIGNSSLCSTEIEKGNREHRIKGFLLPPKIEGVYLRIWVAKRVLILATKNGISLNRKDRVKFKILFGVEGSR